MFTFGGKTYKYRTFWEAQAKTIPAQPKEKQQLAIASLNGLTGIFDDEVKEKIRENPDLLAVASNLILANFCNKNHDCLLLPDLYEVAEKFEYKQLNREHSRADVIGFIDEIGWSSYPSNELIDEEEVLTHDKPVQFVIGAYLWRIVDEDLCRVIEEASNENSPNHGAISTSFELLFDEYWIAVGPKDVTKARLIKPGEDEYEKFDKKLPQNGGDGKMGADYVYRVLKGILPVGAGVVKNPASGLRGIVAVNPNSLAENEGEEDEMQTDANNKNAPLIENFINEEKSRVTENKSQQTEIIMVIAKIEDIEAQFESFTKLPAKEATASIQKIIESKILELSADYAAREKAKDEALANEIKAKAELEERATNLGKAVEDLQGKLAKIEQAQAQAAAEQKFNERMAALDEEFDLDGEDDVRALLVEEIKEITTDEVFASYMDKKKKLMKEKTKAYKKQKAECMKDKMAKAGVKVEVDEKTLDFKEVFASVTPTNEALIPNSSPANEDFKTKFAKAFAEGVSVEGVKTAKE